MSDPTKEPVDPWDRKVAAQYTPMLRGSEEPRWERPPRARPFAWTGLLGG